MKNPHRQMKPKYWNQCQPTSTELEGEESSSTSSPSTCLRGGMMQGGSAQLSARPRIAYSSNSVWARHAGHQGEHVFCTLPHWRTPLKRLIVS